jgi:hypothetical protein
MTTSTPKSANVSFLTINEFKAKLNLDNVKADVVRSPLTNKLFLAIGTSNFKCQQDIDSTKEMKMLIENGDYDNACLTNVKETSNNVLFSL